MRLRAVLLLGALSMPILACAQGVESASGGNVRYVGAGIVGWGPGDIGAQINAAYAALPPHGGTIVVVSPLNGECYNFSTPIVAAVPGKYLLLQGGALASQIARASAPACLNYVPATASTAITLDYVPAGEPANIAAHGIQNLTLVNNRCETIGGCNSGATGISFRGTNGGAAGATFAGVKIIGFDSGISVGASNSRSGSLAFRDCTLSYNTTGFLDTDAEGGHVSFDACHFQGNATAVLSAASLRISNSSIEANTVVGVNCSSPAACDINSDHFENADADSTHFLAGNGVFSVLGGDMRDDRTSGNTDWWMNFAGTSFFVLGTALTSGGRTATHVILSDSSGSVQVQNNSLDVLTDLYSNPQQVRSKQSANLNKPKLDSQPEYNAGDVNLIHALEDSPTVVRAAVLSDPTENKASPNSPGQTDAEPRLVPKRRTCDVKAFGAVGDFHHDDTLAINAAISACAPVGGIVYFPPGIYKAVPTTITADEGGPITIAFPMSSNMHIVGATGATVKLANRQSTDELPRDLALFFTGSALRDVSFYGLTMDMNGANNRISPHRPTTYHRFNMSHIRVSGSSGGIAARIDDIRIEYCQFLNTSGTNAIIAGLSNLPNAILGRRWVIAHNLFMNNGSDTDDHSSIYGWADEMSVHDNTFQEDSPFGTIGRTGGHAAYEVHGSNHVFYDNRVNNYFLGVYLGANRTSPVLNADIHHNVFTTEYAGLNTFRNDRLATPIQGVKIHDNVCIFDDTTYADVNAIKTCIDVQSSYSVSDFRIEHNYGRKTGNRIASVLVNVVASAVADQAFTNIYVNNNTAVGFAQSIAFTSNDASGFGHLEAINNELVGNRPAGNLNISIGIVVNAAGCIQELVLDGNRFINDRSGAAAFQNGIYLYNGTIRNLHVGPQTFNGMTVANYTETGGVTVVNRTGVKIAELQ